MVGIALFVIFSIFLFKSFYKACVVILIWQLVFLHITIGNNYTLNSLLGIIAMLAWVLTGHISDIKWKSIPFRKGYLLMFLSFIFAGIQMKIGGIGSLLSTFLLPLIFWISRDKIKNWTSFVILNLCIFLIPIIFIGLIELVLGYNSVSLWLEFNGIMTFAEVRDDYMRFGLTRCRSLLAWCSTYGVVCGYALITLLFATYYNIVRNRLFIYILSALLFIGVLSTGTRSVYLSFAIGMMPMIAFYSSKLKYIIGFIAICIIVYQNNQELFDSILDSFIHQDEAGGSSTELREQQFAAAYRFFIQHPFFGNGIGYVVTAMDKSTQLLGAESCIFIIMIDRGIFGFIAYAVFNIELVWMLLKKSSNRLLIFIPLGILIGKLISAFIDIGELYPIMWLAIITQIVKEGVEQNSKNNLKCKK